MYIFFCTLVTAEWRYKTVLKSQNLNQNNLFIYAQFTISTQETHNILDSVFLVKSFLIKILKFKALMALRTF